MSNAPITLSDAAAARLAILSEQEGHPVVLRVAVDGGGCSGFSYRFDLVEGPEVGDRTIENAGQQVVIDDVSVALLGGSEIDFVDELAGAQFRVRNPNARSSCGCGVSFSI